MPLLLRPHTAQVLDAQDVLDGGSVIGTSRESTVQIRGQLTPMDARQMVERWGIEIERPHLFLCNESERGKVKEGDHLAIGTREFVVAKLQIWDAESSTSCLALAVNEMQV